MIESIGHWTDRTKVKGTLVQEYMLGSIRAARIMSEDKIDYKAGEEIKYRAYVYRCYLPGVGMRDIGFALTAAEAREEIERIVEDWAFEAGFLDHMYEDEADKIVEATVDFVMPEAVVVIETVQAAPKSANIMPLEDWRRTGQPKPKSDAPWRPSSPFPKTDSAPSKSSIPRKRSHSQRRALTRGQ